jgi:hypothetical protein
MTIVLGVLHQGGVLRSLFTLQKQIAGDSANKEANTDIIYYQTYMPPRFLLAIQEAGVYHRALVDVEIISHL